MRRHELGVGTLYYEILLERSCSGSLITFPSGGGKKRQKQGISPEQKSFPSEMIKGVSITFPDGMVVDIRQTTAPALNRLIELHNKLNQKNDV